MNDLAQAIPGPDPLAVPAPFGLLRALLLLTFFLHLVPMNLVLGGAVLGLFDRFSSRPPARALARDIALALPVLVAATVTFGVAPLLFLQVLYGRLFFASAIAIGWWWLAVIPLVVAGYYGAYRAAHLARSSSGRGRVAAVVVAFAFLAVAFVYVNNMSLMLDPARIVAVHRSAPSGTGLAVADPAFLPRWLHMISGALAVSGLAVALYGSSRKDADSEDARFAVTQGRRVLLGAVAAGAATGFWWLLALPREVMSALTMKEPVAATVVGLGIFAGLVTLALAAMATLSSNPRRLLGGATAALAATLVLMVVSRDQLRSIMLARAGFVPSTWVQTQWGPLAIFAVLLVVAAVLVLGMVRALVTARGTDTGAAPATRSLHRGA